MIKIIKDISGGYISIHKHTVVKDLETYFASRKQFFKSYKNEQDYEIVVKNKRYFQFFLDLESYEGVVVEEVREVVEPKIDLGSTQNIFGALLNSLQLKENEKKVIGILEKEYLQNYDFIFNLKERKLEKYLYTLVKMIVFSKYKECNFIVLMGDQYVDGTYRVSREDSLLRESFEKEKHNLMKYIEKCNSDLKKSSKMMSLFTEFPTENYLEEINGELAFEKEYFLKVNIERLNGLKNYENIIRNLDKAEKTFKESYSDVKEVANILMILEKEKKIDKDTFEKFKEYFTTIYLNYNNISEDKNLNETVEKIEKKYGVNLSSLKQSIQNIWKLENRKFEEFYLKKYNQLYSSYEQKGLDYALDNNYSLLNNGKKNIYIFIDCLRYDVWLGVKKYIETKGYSCHSDKILLSGIPTVTSYCKKMLYSGKKYNQIDSRDNFKYSVNKISSIDEFQNLNENSDYLYEIIDLDNFFHSIKDLTDQHLQNSIELKLNKMFEDLDKEKFNIVVMTDHGAMKLSEDGLSSFSKYKNILNEKNLQIENHGRYIKVYSNYYDDELYSELYNYFKDNNDFYIINREEMNKFYLPVAEKDKENYFYFIYKYGKYPKRTGEYNHGGISFEEVMIPYGVFKSEKREYIPIEIEIKSEEIKNDSKAELDILIKNSNIIERLNLKLKYQDYEKEYSELEGNKRIQIPLIKLLPEMQILNDILEIELQVYGEKYSLQKSVQVKLVKSQKDLMNKKMKNSRSLI